MSHPAPSITTFPSATPNTSPSASSSGQQADDPFAFARHLQSAQGQSQTGQVGGKTASKAAAEAASGSKSDTAQETDAASETVLEGLVAQVLSGNSFLHLPAEHQSTAHKQANSPEELAAGIAALQAALGTQKGIPQGGDATHKLVQHLQHLQAMQGEKGTIAGLFSALGKGGANTEKLLQQLMFLHQGTSGAGENTAGLVQAMSRLQQEQVTSQGGQAGLVRAVEVSQSGGTPLSQIQSVLSGAQSQGSQNTQVTAEGAPKQAPWLQLASFATASGSSGQGEHSLAGLMQQSAEQGLTEQGHNGQQLRQALAAVMAEGQQKTQVASGTAPEGTGQVRSGPGQNAAQSGSEGGTSTGFAEHNVQANRAVQTSGSGKAYQGASPFETQVLEQVRIRFQAGARQGQSEIVVRMRPPELGEVRLNLRSEDGVLRAHLHAQSQQVHDVLERHAPQLRQALAEQGLNLDDLLVSSDGAGSQDTQSEWQAAEDGSSQKRGTPQAHAGEENHEEPTVQTVAGSVGNVSGALSLRV